MSGSQPGLTWMKGGLTTGTAHVVTAKGSDHYITLCGVTLSTKYAVHAMKYTSRCIACVEKLADKDRVGKIENCPYCGEPYLVSRQNKKYCDKATCNAERKRLYQANRKFAQSVQRKVARA